MATEKDVLLLTVLDTLASLSDKALTAYDKVLGEPYGIDGAMIISEIGNCVKKVGDQTIGGVKTFSSSPIVPTPTTDMQASTKKYVDDNISTTVDLDNVTVSFTEAVTRANIATGETIPTLMGKIKKWYSDFGSFAWLSSLAFSALTGKPTTISGYGITDAYTKTEVDNISTTVDLDNVTVSFTEAVTRANIATGETIPTLMGKIKKWYTDFGSFAWLSSLTFSALTGKPTTISGYGITDAYTKTEVDNKVASVYKFKGSVANYAALPSTGLTAGDVYNLTDTGVNYGWTGTEWDALGAVYSEATTSVAGLMSAADKTRLNGIATGAEVNVQSDWNQTTDTADDYIKNKPTIPTVTNDFTNAYKAVIDFMEGKNSVTSLASLPVTKRSVLATLSTASTLSLDGTLAEGREIHIRVENSTASAITITLPATGDFISKKDDGTNITSVTLKASGNLEINIWSVNSKYYIRTNA